jgi:hypothetical protein
LTEEQILERGIQAAKLLEDDVVMSFFKEQMNDIKTCLFNTPLEHVKEREKLFFVHWGVQDFINRLTAYRDAAVQILERDENK